MTATEAAIELMEYRKLLLEDPSDSAMDTGCLLAKAIEIFTRMDKSIHIEKMCDNCGCEEGGRLEWAMVCTQCGKEHY